MTIILSKIAAAVSALAVVNAAIVEHWWNITHLEANPDGVSPCEQLRKSKWS